MSAELSTSTEIKKPAIGETVDLDAMSAQERFDYLNQMNGDYYTEQGLTADTLDDYLSALEAEQDSSSPEIAAEAQEIRAQVYELAADGKNADKNRVMQLVLEVTNLIRRGAIKLATGMALLVVLAGCGPTTEATPSPDPEISAPATPENPDTTEAPEEPELSPEEITASFEIPADLEGQALAEAYVDRINRWWNYGTDPALKDDERRSDLGLEAFSKLIASESSDDISEGVYTSDNEQGISSSSNIQANTIERYIQSLLKGETPYEHNLELVSLDEVGDNGDIHVMVMTVKETTTDLSDPVNSRSTYQIEVHFVKVGDTKKVQSDLSI